MIKNFACFKVTDKKEDQPDYRLTAKVGDNYVDIGAGWIKDSKNGKYISFSLSKPYNDKKGWQLVEETGISEKMEKLYTEMDKPEGDIPF